MLGLQPIACTLPERYGSLLMCIGGQLKPVAEALEDLALSCRESERGLQPGIDSWVIDSGSGRHLVSRKVLDENASKHIVTVDEPLRLSTANGVVATKEKVKIYIRGIDVWLTAWVLEETPLVISINGLVEEYGFNFKMQQIRGKSKATLTKGNQGFRLSVVQGVPVLQA